MSHFRRAATLVVRGLQNVDQGLIQFARLFGVRTSRGYDRVAMLLVIYLAIYTLALLPCRWLPLVALGFGYLGVVAVGRAWVADEKRRLAIARRLADGDPDERFDLRPVALLSALQLVVLFPLLFRSAQDHFKLFHVPADATFWSWLGFTFDSCSRRFLAAAEVYDFRFTEITCATPWGKHLVVAKRLTIDFILVQSVLRLLAIRAQIGEASDVVRHDAYLAARQGRRVVPTLIRLLDHTDAGLRRQAALALAAVPDPRAAEPLRRVLEGDDCGAVREAAAQALAELADQRAVAQLLEVLRKPLSEKIVLFHDRRQAARSLGRLGDRRAVPALVEAYHRHDGLVRQTVLQALTELGEMTLAAELQREANPPTDVARPRQRDEPQGIREFPP